MKTRIPAALAIASALALCGCGGNSNEPAAPAPQPTSSGVEIIHFGSDNFRDVATVCNHGNRIYQNDFNSDNTLRIVENDPSCAKG